MRSFVALEVPPAVRMTVERAVDPLRRRRDGLRWTPAEQWHITVAFIGSVESPPSEIAHMLGGPAAAAPETIHLSIGGPGRFGRRVLWLEVTDRPRGAVAALGASVQEALSGAGIPVDAREVHPHLTLARTGRGGRARIDAATVEAVPGIDASWEIDDLVLYASVQQGHGRPNRYEVQARVPLGGPYRAR